MSKNETHVKNTFLIFPTAIPTIIVSGGVSKQLNRRIENGKESNIREIPWDTCSADFDIVISKCYV